MVSIGVSALCFETGKRNTQYSWKRSFKQDDAHELSQRHVASETRENVIEGCIQISRLSKTSIADFPPFFVKARVLITCTRAARMRRDEDPAAKSHS